MRKVLLAFAIMMVAILMAAGVASAITDGQPDGNRHPNVGGLVNDTQYSDGTWLYCSGTLISPTVFLTAAHCGDEGTSVRVTFDPAYQDGDKTYAGTFHADPAYPGPSSDAHDIAVVVLDKPIKGITPATLPGAGSLSSLPGDQKFTPVGYGAYEVTNEPGGPPVPLRRRATVCHRHAQRHQQDLAAHLHERLDRQRRHLLRRLRRAELPRRHRYHRGHHDHGRRRMPLDERSLSSRHRVGACVSQQLRDPPVRGNLAERRASKSSAPFGLLEGRRRACPSLLREVSDVGLHELPVDGGTSRSVP